MNSSMNAVLYTAYLHSFKIQSDYSREFAQEVAALASLGYISTVEAPGVFGRSWRCTGIGLEVLRKGGLL